MELGDYLIIIYLLVLALAFWLTRWWRSRLRHQEQNPPQEETAVYMFGQFSPILTWLKGRFPQISARWPTFAVKDKVLSTPGIYFFYALISVAVAQYLIEKRQTNEVSFSIISEWNDTLRIDLLNWENMIVALPLLVVGGLLFVLVNKYRPWLQEKQTLLAWPTLAQLDWRSALRYLVLALLLIVVMLVQLRIKNESFVPLMMGVVALAILSWLVYCWDRDAHIDLGLNLTYLDLAWMLALLMVGLVVGSYYLRDIPARLVGDEGKFWETARMIALGDYQPSPFGAGVYTFPIASSYFQAAVMRVFGIDLWGWRFSSVLAGVVAVVPLYLFTRLWFDRRTAVVASFAMLTSAYFLAFIRMGYNNSQALFPLVLALFFWSMAVKRSSYFYCWLTGLTVGLGFYTYTAAQLSVIVIVLTGLYLIKQRRTSVRTVALAGFLIFIGWILVLAPRVFYEAVSDNAVSSLHKMGESAFFNVFYGRVYFTDSQLFRLMAPLEMGHNELFFEPILYAKLLARGLIRSLLSFHSPFFNDSDHFVETGLAGGWIAPIFFTFGLAVALRDWSRFRFTLLLVWLGSGLFLLSVINTFPPRYTHLVTIIPVISIFVALGVVAVVEMVMASMKVADRSRAVVLPLLLILSVFVLGYGGWHHYFEKIEAAYPDSFEQAISWAAWRLGDEAMTLAYIEPTRQSHDVEYLARIKLIAQDYRNFTPDQLFKEDDPLAGTEQVIAFFLEDERDDLSAQLPWAIPNTKPVVAILDKQERIQGYAITNSDVELNPVLTFAGGVESLVYSPLWKALLFPLVGFLLVLFSGKWVG